MLEFRRPDAPGTARCAGGEDLKSVPAGLQEVCPLLEKTGAEGAVCSVLEKTGARPGRRAESAPRRSVAGSEPRSASLRLSQPTAGETVAFLQRRPDSEDRPNADLPVCPPCFGGSALRRRRLPAPHWVQGRTCVVLPSPRGCFSSSRHWAHHHSRSAEGRIDRRKVGGGPSIVRIRALLREFHSSHCPTAEESALPERSGIASILASFF